jgi:hypothetical protein
MFCGSVALTLNSTYHLFIGGSSKDLGDGTTSSVQEGVNAHARFPFDGYGTKRHCPSTHYRGTNVTWTLASNVFSRSQTAPHSISNALSALMCLGPASANFCGSPTVYRHFPSLDSEVLRCPDSTSCWEYSINDLDCQPRLLSSFADVVAYA